MIPLFIRGRLRREEDNWIVRSFINIYKPVLTWLMHVPALGLWFMGFLFSSAGLAGVFVRGLGRRPVLPVCFSPGWELAIACSAGITAFTPGSPARP
jgi:hypothetical protein